MKRVIPFLLAALLIFALIPVAYAQAFTLSGPTGATLVRDLDTHLASFTWTPLGAATSYDLSLFKVSTHPRDGRALGLVFTRNVSTAACTGSLCTYATTGPDKALIDRGSYAWTVVASTAGGDVEATNAPFYFSYESLPIATIFNAGFETGGLSPWTGVNLTADKVKAGVGNGGGYGFQFKGSAGENSSIKQKVNVTYYNINVGDTLTFKVDYKANTSGVNGHVMAKIKYTAASGLAKEKVTLTASLQTSYFTASVNIVPDGPIQTIQVTARHFSTTGKYTVDNLQVIINAVP